MRRITSDICDKRETVSQFVELEKASKIYAKEIGDLCDCTTLDRLLAITGFVYNLPLLDCPSTSVTLFRLVAYMNDFFDQVVSWKYRTQLVGLVKNSLQTAEFLSGLDTLLLTFSIQPKRWIVRSSSTVNAGLRNVNM